MCVYICTHTHSYVSWCPEFVDQLHGVNLKNSWPTLWRNNMPSLSGHLGEFAAGKGIIVGMNGYDMFRFRLFRWIFVGFYNAFIHLRTFMSWIATPVRQVESGPQSILGQPWLDSFNLLSKR